MKIKIMDYPGYAVEYLMKLLPYTDKDRKLRLITCSPDCFVIWPSVITKRKSQGFQLSFGEDSYEVFRWSYYGIQEKESYDKYRICIITLFGFKLWLDLGRFSRNFRSKRYEPEQADGGACECTKKSVDSDSACLCGMD